ncbi:3D domain-containing protein [Deinococcus sp. PESE-13]
MSNPLKFVLSAAALGVLALSPATAQFATPAGQSAFTPAVAAEGSVTAPVSRPVFDDLLGASRGTGRSLVIKATAYNSLSSQTDSTPHITATGTRTRPGVVALSRDLLRVFPYGTRVTIQDLSGRYNFAGRVFIVEDTMHARKTNQVDIWMPTYREAINFGSRTVRITALR